LNYDHRVVLLVLPRTRRRRCRRRAQRTRRRCRRVRRRQRRRHRAARRAVDARHVAAAAAAMLFPTLEVVELHVAPVEAQRVFHRDQLELVLLRDRHGRRRRLLLGRRQSGLLRRVRDAVTVTSVDCATST